MKCAICGRQVPITLPPYMRIHKDKNGKWVESAGVCKCNKEMYDFMVLGLLKRKEQEAKEN